MADSPGGHGSYENCGEHSPQSSVREPDRFLPIANIGRIMKKGLPSNGKIAKDAKDTVQESVSEFIKFISFVTSEMNISTDASGEPIQTSSVLMAAAKHIGSRCRGESLAFLKCKKDDPNPEKCLYKGRQLTVCVLHLLKDFHQNCSKEMNAYAGCMDYHTNEFELCREEQNAFEKACPF